MITIGIKNFKSFYELEGLEIKPLTILCGPNSSGKSTILQSILLQKQSIVPRRSESLPLGSIYPLIFNGPFIHLGRWPDVIHESVLDRRLSFSWKFDKSYLDSELSTISTVITSWGEIGRRIIYHYGIDPPIELQNITFDIGFSLNEASSPTRNVNVSYSKLSLHPFESGFSLEKTDEAQWSFDINSNLVVFNNIKQFEERLDRLLKRRVKKKSNIKRIEEYLTEKGEELLKSPEIENFSAHEISTTGFFPERIFFSKNEIKKLNKSILNPLKDIFEEISEISVGIDDRFLKPPVLSMLSEESHPKLRHSFPLSQIPFYEGVQRFLLNFLEKIRYLGPLRDEPKRFYQFDDIGGVDIGVKGEFSAQVLSILGKIVIDPYYTIQKKGTSFSLRKKSKDTLRNALNYWFVYMELGSVDPGIFTEPYRLYRVDVDQEGLKLPISDVGFGISQFLPVAIESLRMSKGETLILEQPEVHLHPRLQSRLADFLICLAKSNRQFIIETHSEYLIRRVALRIAQDTKYEIKDLVNIQFIEKEGSCSKTTPIEINEYGEIETWPSGFLDDLDSISLMEANLRKRKKGG
ncbi:MAG: DUF3696 domain-containing protein [Candidatus Hodarchaeales archaeon]